MPSDDHSDRLNRLNRVPFLSGLDHRWFLDKEGRDVRTEALSRKQRRRMKAEGHRIGMAYANLIDQIGHYGAGFQNDQMLRQLAIEYTHRYASAGIHSQPTSFNYFEPFCDIEFIPKSVGPYTAPAPEIDHLFSLSDYFDYITSPKDTSFDIGSLIELPEGKIFHYTPNGSILDFTFTSPQGRDFLIAGFSMVRRGRSLHWYVVGGEKFSREDWDVMAEASFQPDPGDFFPAKALFLQSVVARNGPEAGPPVALDGTDTAQRTLIAGETDLLTRKHVGRYLATETKNTFQGISDDPELFEGTKLSQEERLERLDAMQTRVNEAAVMWGLAEAMFELPAYFNHRIAIARDVAVAGGKRLPPTTPKAAKGQGVKYRYVSAIEYADDGSELVRTYAAPRYQIETEGYWRRLDQDEYGRDSDGALVRGRTWINAAHPWRDRTDAPRPIYIKSSVAAARIKQKEYRSRAEVNLVETEQEEPTGVLYAMRCFTMEDEVYKVGFTDGTASKRARELSAATGVPSAFVVMKFWENSQPHELEGDVHAMLAPYRVSDNREFFKANFAVINSIVEAVIARKNR